MRVEILATESLGVRGLCCVVRTRHRHIVIDPGLALGYRRDGLLPHPRQVAVGVTTARRILYHLAEATDVVFSHYHGDHIPLAAANPFQLPLSAAGPLLKRSRPWGKDPAGEPLEMAGRCRELETAASRPIVYGNDRVEEIFTFSPAMPHGDGKSARGTVMMTRIADDKAVFVHASDIQLLDDAPVALILEWRPTLLLVSGPPLYRGLTSVQLAAARRRAETLARAVPCCVMDHHLLRSRSGLQWLEDLRGVGRGRVLCAADFMGVERCLLEADRAALYGVEPVAPDWHESYRRPDLFPCGPCPNDVVREKAI